MKTQTVLQASRGLIFWTAWTLLIIFTQGLVNTAQAARGTDPMDIIKNASITGKFHPGECQAFSDELFRRLDAAGVEAYKVTFNWESYKFTARTRAGTHMFVVFKDARGRYYGVDNMSRRPMWLQGSSPAEWTEFFAGMDMGTGVSNSVASSAARGTGNSFVALR